MPNLATGILVFFLTLILTTSSSFSGQSLLADKTIVIDPGHGGIYPGAVHNGIREANLNLTVALKVRDRLVAAGATVVLTRTSDTNLAAPGASLADDLQARVDVAKAAGADIFVSLHANADEDVNTAGVIGFYPTGRPDDLARALKEGAVQETGAVDGGVRPANFYVLRNSDIPAALLEMGFLTCQAEAAWLSEDDYQNHLADGICRGLSAISDHIRRPGTTRALTCKTGECPCRFHATIWLRLFFHRRLPACIHTHGGRRTKRYRPCPSAASRLYFGSSFCGS